MSPRGRSALSHKFEADSRGKAELRGVSEPVALYAPSVAGQVEAEVEERAPVGASGEGDGLGSALRRRLPRPPRIRR